MSILFPLTLIYCLLILVIFSLCHNTRESRLKKERFINIMVLYIYSPWTAGFIPFGLQQDNLCTSWNQRAERSIRRYDISCKVTTLVVTISNYDGLAQHTQRYHYSLLSIAAPAEDHIFTTWTSVVIIYLNHTTPYCVKSRIILNLSKKCKENCVREDF